MSYLICKYGKSGGGLKTSLDITCDEDFIGETITFTNGTSTLTATVDSTLTVEFDIPEPGTWILSNSLTSETDTYNITDTVYTKTLFSTPDGKTVLPVNDVEIWQKCAGITPVYDTLAEVLHDSSLTIYLMANDNAVDYLVRSTEWAVSEALVPTMTSDTTPSGTCSASTYYSDSTKAYKAFDGDDGTRWESANVSPFVNVWIQYDFTESIQIGNFSMLLPVRNQPAAFTLQGSNDGALFTDIANYTNSTTSSVSVSYTNSNIDSYRYWRLLITSIHKSSESSSYWTGLNSLQFYSTSVCDNANAMAAIGASDYAANTLLANSTWCNAICNSNYFESVLTTKVPYMTSNTAPKGLVASDNTQWANREYGIFDGNIRSAYDSAYGWLPARNTTNHYVYYRFDNDTLIKKCTITNNWIKPTARAHTVSGEVIVSNDGSTWNAVNNSSFSMTGNANNTVLSTNVILSDNNIQCKYIGIRNTNVWDTVYSGDSAATYAPMSELQFYGRENSGVQTWLHAAGITDKPYTTLAEVLNDTTTLTALMNSTDAVDYLVTIPSWAKSVSLVPTMTSNTAPSGECFGSSYDSSDTYYKAFDGNDASGSRWIASTARGTACYIGYHFTTATTCIKAKFIQDTSITSTTAIIQGSNDRVTWTDLCDSTSYTASENTIQFTKNIEGYTDYRLYISTQSGSVSKGGQIVTLQFYSASITDNSDAMTAIGNSNYASNTLLGDSTWRTAICNSTYFESVLNVKVPTMTSDTTPSGVASASSYDSDHYAYKAMDGNDGSYWFCRTNDSTLGYDFGESKNVYMAAILQSSQDSSTRTYTEKIQSSTDGVTWNDESTAESVSTSTTTKTTKLLFAANNKNAYRLNITSSQGRSPAVFTIQFYGREDV